MFLYGLYDEWKSMMVYIRQTIKEQPSYNLPRDRWLHNRLCISNNVKATIAYRISTINSSRYHKFLITKIDEMMPFNFI